MAYDGEKVGCVQSRYKKKHNPKTESSLVDEGTGEGGQMLLGGPHQVGFADHLNSAHGVEFPLDIVVNSRCTKKCK